MPYYSLFITVIMVLSSCDPGVSYERIIENNSSHDIWIKTADNSYLEFIQDSFSISKNSEQIISTYNGLGQTVDFENCGMADSIIYGGVIDADSLSISIDLNNESNWVFTVLETKFKQGGTCECRLKITDSEIE